MACRTHQSISALLVPWDDRRAHEARIEDLREGKVREYLRDVRSGLLDEPNERDVYRRMRLTRKVNDHEVPRNAALLFFSVDPTRWFRGAKIEVVLFAADRAGDVQEERNFGGGLADQLNDCLNYLENLSVNHLQKQPHGSQARGWVGVAPRRVGVGVEPRLGSTRRGDDRRVRAARRSLPRRTSVGAVRGRGGGDRRFVRQEPADRGARGSRRARKGAPAAAHGGWARLAPLNYSNSRRTRATTCCATSTAAAAWVRVYTSEGTPPGRPFGYRVGT